MHNTVLTNCYVYCKGRTKTAGWMINLSVKTLSSTSISTPTGLYQPFMDQDMEWLPDDVELHLFIPAPHPNSKLYSKIPSCPRFGGDYLAIIGACQCDVGVWDDQQLECQVGAQVKEFSIQCRESQVYWQVKEPCNRLWDDCIAKYDSGFAFICDESIS